MSKKDGVGAKEQKFYNKWWFWVIVAFIIIGAGSAGMNAKSNNGDSSQNNNNSSQNNGSSQNEKSTLSLGDTFQFDDLEITIGKEYSFTVLDNQFSEHDKAEVVKLPVTVKNLKDEAHNLNMFYVKIFGSKGTELDGVSSYFMDDENIDFAGELRSGASYTKYFHFLYDGDGKYAMDFATLIGKKTTVEFNISK